VIGALKAGTTSLHFYLDQHPDVSMSRVKEPHHFARPEDGPYPGRVETREDYEVLFDASASARGESSPTYSLFPRHKEVPERIAAAVPDARIIYLVRDPVDRVISHYMHERAVVGLGRSFEEEIGDLSSPTTNSYIYPSLYAMQLERYLQVFPESQVRVVDQAELLRDRAECLSGIFRFLEVDPSFYSPRFEERAGTSSDRRRYPVWYARTLNRPAPKVVRWLPRDVRRRMRMVAERTFWPPVEQPEVSVRMRERIQELCGPDTSRLRELTGLRFASWTV
jgi:hypothetical protein